MLQTSGAAGIRDCTHFLIVRFFSWEAPGVVDFFPCDLLRKVKIKSEWNLTHSNTMSKLFLNSHGGEEGP